MMNKERKHGCNFLKLDDIKGESQFDGFKDQIEIMSYSHNVSMQVSNDVSNTERTSGRVHVGEMSLTKFVDLSTPKLNEYCCSGKMVRVVLTLCRNDDGKMLPFIVYTLDNVIISNLSVSGGYGGKPVESMSLNFTKIKLEIPPPKTGKHPARGSFFRLGYGDRQEAITWDPAQVTSRRTVR